MKINILFALPGPQHSVQGDKLLVVSAATEHEDPQYLSGVIAEVAENALEVGAYRAVRKITLELDDALVLALLQGEAMRTMPRAPRATVHRAMLN